MVTLETQQSFEFAGTHPAEIGGIAVVPAANAVTAVALAAYLLCAVVSIVAPGLLVAFFQPWLHGLSLAPLRPEGTWFRPAELAVGLITFGVSAWLVTAAVAWLYNAWTRRLR